MSGETCLILAKAGGGKTDTVFGDMAMRILNYEPTVYLSFDTHPKFILPALDKRLDCVNVDASELPLVCGLLRKGDAVEFENILTNAANHFQKNKFGDIMNVYVDGIDFIRRANRTTKPDVDELETLLRSLLPNGDRIRLVLTAQANRTGFSR